MPRISARISALRNAQLDRQIEEVLREGRGGGASDEYRQGVAAGEASAREEMRSYGRASVTETLGQLTAQARAYRSDFVLGQIAGYDLVLLPLSSRRSGRSASGEVAVDTTLYRRTHGAEPRGRGRWTFVIGKLDYDYSDDPALYVVDTGLTFNKAKERAVAEAKRRFQSVVGVAP